MEDHSAQATDSPGSAMKLTSRSARRRRLLLWFSLLALCAVGLACEFGKGANKPTGPVQATIPGNGEPYGSPPVWDDRPSFKVSISDVKENWSDKQQTFTLNLTNTGDRVEKVHALIYATNEDNPPRRALSPQTADGWFELVESRDGQLSPLRIQSVWTKDAFFTARGGRLKFSWDATVRPLASVSFPAGLDLESESKFPATKGQHLARKGFTQYRVWLFTDDGRWFHEQIIPGKDAGGEKPPTQPSTTKPDTKPDNPAAEKEAAEALKLARYYLMGKDLEAAKGKLQLILDRYPKTDAAREAGRMLKEIKGK